MGRLAPDMIPFKGQIMIATDHAKGATARLADKPVPSWPDTETTFEQLKTRINTALSFLAEANAADFVGADERKVTLRNRNSETILDGQTYLLERALPNFYFHITTAYAILRHNGVPVGKGDFLG